MSLTRMFTTPLTMCVARSPRTMTSSVFQPGYSLTRPWRVRWKSSFLPTVTGTPPFSGSAYRPVFGSTKLDTCDDTAQESPVSPSWICASAQAGQSAGTRAMHVVQQAGVAHVLEPRRKFLLAPFVFEADHVVLVVGVGDDVRVRLFAAGLLRGIGVDLAVLHRRRCWTAGGALAGVFDA